MIIRNVKKFIAERVKAGVSKEEAAKEAQAILANTMLELQKQKSLIVAGKSNEAEEQYKKMLACNGKKGYASLDAARRAATKASLRTREDISAYKCEHCADYHIGHEPYQGRRQR